MTRKMALCMALAPHLATLTYASPHLIGAHAVPGAVLRPIKELLKHPLLVKPTDNDAWCVLPADDHQVLDAEVSDAKLCATPLSPDPSWAPSGLAASHNPCTLHARRTQQQFQSTVQWTVEAPIKAALYFPAIQHLSVCK